MSATLLKKSLELLEASCTPCTKSGKAKNPFIPEQNQPKATISSIIKSKKKRKHTETKLAQPRQKSRTTVTRSTIQDQLKGKSLKAEENLQKLLMLNSSVNLDKETTQKLIKRAQTQKYVIPDSKTKEEQATAFTDEDFRKFEREYFCS